jgi:hypothetical protein
MIFWGRFRGSCFRFTRGSTKKFMVSFILNDKIIQNLEARIVNSGLKQGNFFKGL